MCNKKHTCLLPVRVISVISKYVNHHSSCSTCTAAENLNVTSNYVQKWLYLLLVLKKLEFDLCHATDLMAHIQVYQYATQKYTSITDIICNVGDIIANCFPNLVRLILRGPVTEGVHIALKNSHFRDVDIQMRGLGRDKSSSKYGFSFKPPNMTETKYYMCSYQKTDQVDSGDIKGLPLLSVECFTERKSGFTQQDLHEHTSNSLLSLRKGMCALKLY